MDGYNILYDHYLCSQTRQMDALKQNLTGRIQGLQIQNDQLQIQNDQLQTELRRLGGDEKQKLSETVIYLICCLFMLL